MKRLRVHLQVTGDVIHVSHALMLTGYGTTGLVAEGVWLEHVMHAVLVLQGVIVQDVQGLHLEHVNPVWPAITVWVVQANLPHGHQPHVTQGPI